MSKALLSLLWLIIMYWSCTTQLAGGSSQQGNAKITGSVVLSNGGPAKLTKIRVRPVGYVQTFSTDSTKDSVFDAVTDSKGQFSVSGVFPGNYSIEANDMVSSAALVKITVEDQDKAANVGTIGLKAYANVTGIVNDSVQSKTSGLYVQVLGLERLEPVREDGTFSIDDLPEGSFELRFISNDQNVKPVEVFGIDARSGVTESVVIPAGWHYLHRLHLNTTATGADIDSDIIDFPVLIRLNAFNFDFSQANSNGTDVRFTKSDNTGLPFEIERWDSKNKLAELWVKLDTIRANDSVQTITMHWGNPDVSESSNGALVFDTSSGFSGVWHLSEKTDIISDATYNKYDGTNTGSAITEGIIGNARNFSNNSIRIQGLLDSLSSVTLSAWAETDTTSGYGQDMISIGDVILIRMDDNSGIGTLGSFYYDSAYYTQCYSGKFLRKTGWHYIVYSFDSEKHTQTLYIDGIQAALTTDSNSINYSGHGTDTYIGNHGNGKQGFNYVGRIDEVRVNHAPVSANWIRLCYMNQKAEDKLVGW